MTVIVLVYQHNYDNTHRSIALTTWGIKLHFYCFGIQSAHVVDVSKAGIHLLGILLKQRHLPESISSPLTCLGEGNGSICCLCYLPTAKFNIQVFVAWRKYMCKLHNVKLNIIQGFI